MKHTREQLDGMSDLEITEIVAKNLGMEIINHSYDAVMCGYTGMRSTVADRNYCNNWNDIMPLAVEHGVVFIQINGTYYAEHRTTKEFFANESPQRAIACCLVMVLEVKE